MPSDADTTAGRRPLDHHTAPTTMKSVRAAPASHLCADGMLTPPVVLLKAWNVTRPAMTAHAPTISGR
jgi:hypothetical protein